MCGAVAPFAAAAVSVFFLVASSHTRAQAQKIEQEKNLTIIKQFKFFSFFLGVGSIKKVASHKRDAIKQIGRLREKKRGQQINFLFLKGTHISKQKYKRVSRFSGGVLNYV